MKKLKNKSGFTLIEMLIAVAILVILIVAMQSGLTAGTKAYTASIFESNSAALEGILNTALGDILRYSEAITPNPGFSVEPHAPEGFKDDFGNILLPADVPFVYTNYDYNVRNAYFDIMPLDPDDPVDTLVIKNLQCSNPVELVNTGAYPGLAIADFKIEYDKDRNLYNIEYQIVDTESHNAPRDAHCTVRIMNPDSDELPTTETTGPSEPEPTIAWPDHRPDGGGGTTPGGGSSGGGGESGGETLPSCKHNYVEKTEKEATCTETGLKRFTCSLCGDNYTETIKALGHDWSAWEIKEAPTDSSKGLKTRQCQRTGCGVLDKKEFSASECQHTYTETPDKNVAATCTEAGSKVYTCSKCGHVKTETIKALGHDLNGKVEEIAPTCTEKGYTRHYCSKCKTYYEDTDFVKATGHALNGKVEKIAPTCTEKGYTRRYCSKCKTYYKDTDFVKATGHALNGKVEKIAPTCTEKGYTRRYCSKCKTYYKDTDFVKATGHTWGDWVTDPKPTVEKEGLKTRTCTQKGCGATETQSIPKLPDLSVYPEWKNWTGYVRGNIVRYEGKLYVAKKGELADWNLGRRPTNQNYWAETSFWNPEKVYTRDEIVIYGDTAYQAKNRTQNNEPGKTDHWKVY